YLPAAGDGSTRRLDPASLSAADLNDVLRAAEAVGEAWQAVADPHFPWRGLRTDRAHPGPVLEEARTALDGLLCALDGYGALAWEGGRFTTPDQVNRLVQLLRLLNERLPAPEWWLTEADMAHAVTDPVESFLGTLRHVRRAEQTAQNLVGDRWEELSPRLRPEPPAAEEALLLLQPRGLELTGLTEQQMRDLSQDFEQAADSLQRATAAARDLAGAMGLDEPRSLSEATALCDLADLSALPHRPLEAWFSPEGLAAAQEAALSLVMTAVTEFQARRDRTAAALATAREQAGPGWAEMPSHLPKEPETAEAALDVLEPSAADVTVLGRDEAASLAARWSALADMLEGTADCAMRAADLLGCDSPDTAFATRSVSELAALAESVHRAPAAWFDPDVLPRVRRAVDELHQLMDVLDRARREAQGVFGPGTPYAEGLTEAVRRLSENGRRVAAALSAQVRADRKVVGAVSTGGSWTSGLQAELDKAEAWQQAHRAVRAAVTANAELLATYASDGL